MEKIQKKNSLKNIEIQVITNLSQEEQIEVINMKENEIFSIVRNGLYEQYLKLITNIDINSQNEYGQNLLQEAIEANKDKIAIDLVNKRIDINHQDDKGFSSLHYCAQFSKTFKGTLSKLKPSTRGTINRGINSGIDEINSTVGSGEVMFDAIDFLKPEDKE